MIGILKKLGSYLKNKKTIYLIDSEEDEDFVKESIRKEKCIGLDTEFNWRNTYFPELSLLQISTSSKILLIDCLKYKKMGFLNKVLEDKTKKIVMHSSRSDTTVLSTNLNVKLNNCFDIQIAEKHINGGEIKNYGFIVSKYCGYDLDKSETNSNWLKRPLTDAQIKYAANDVNFLISIYKMQLKKLKKLKKASKLEKDIFLWREKYAKQKNIPPSYIFGDKVLKKIVNIINNKEKESDEIKKLFKDNNAAKDFLAYIEL